MVFRLYVRTVNAAFEDDDPGELVRILRGVADRIEAAGAAPTQYLTILDVNGNGVGRYALKGDDGDLAPGDERPAGFVDDGRRRRDRRGPEWHEIRDTTC